MADAKITELDENTTPAADDLIAVVDVSDTPDTTEKATVLNILNATGNLTTGTNGGASGGDTNYIKVGGVTICWGLTSPGATIATGADQTITVTLPVTYASAPKGFIIPYGSGSYCNWVFANVVSTSTTNLTGYMHNSGAGTTGTEKAMWFTIGTT